MAFSLADASKKGMRTNLVERDDHGKHTDRKSSDESSGHLRVSINEEKEDQNEE